MYALPYAHLMPPGISPADGTIRLVVKVTKASKLSRCMCGISQKSQGSFSSSSQEQVDMDSNWVPSYIMATVTCLLCAISSMKWATAKKLTHTQANSSFLFLRMKYARLSLRQLTTKTERRGLKKLFAFVRFFFFSGMSSCVGRKQP